MNGKQADAQILQTVCCGNQQAAQWLALWRDYCHAIDDIEDGPTTPEHRLATFAAAVELYTHPFFKAHEATLKQIVLNTTNAYADSVRWEKSSVPWQREWADHYRHFGVEMLLAVAGICGGYQAMRGISLELRANCHHDHHDEKGNPV